MAGAAWSTFISFTVETLSLHYYTVVNLTGSVICCYGLSLIENIITSGPAVGTATVMDFHGGH